VASPGPTSPTSTVEPLFHATAGATAACAVAALVNGFTVPTREGLVWLALLALLAQVFGWLLISAAIPALGATVTSAVLLSQPVGALIMSHVLFQEDPSRMQLGGVLVILTGLVLATASPRSAAP
jgi:drug/metabolite transporter (DMT)-like permease